MSTALPENLRRIASETAAAHKAVTDTRKKHNKAAHRRNLALYVLFFSHNRTKVAPLTRLAGIHRTEWYTLKKKAPVPSKLKKWSVAEAEAIIAEQLKTIADLASEEDAARERRIRGVLALSQALIDGEPLTNADIARETDMAATMVGTDLQEAAERGFTGEVETPAETSEMIPLTIMAERLGVPIERLMERVDVARRNGHTPEGMSRVGSRVNAADPAVFTPWWDCLHLGWVTLSEFAEARGTTYEEVFARLRYARNRHGLDLVLTDEYGGADLYEPEELGRWWEQYMGRSEALSRGFDDAGRRNYAGLGALLGLTGEQVKERVRTWQDRGDTLPPHVVDEQGMGIRWWEPVEFVAKVRGVEALLVEPVSAVVPARAVRPLQEVGVESVRDLLYRGEKDLGAVPGLGATLVGQIVAAVAGAGLIFR